MQTQPHRTRVTKMRLDSASWIQKAQTCKKKGAPFFIFFAFIQIDAFCLLFPLSLHQHLSTRPCTPAISKLPGRRDLTTSRSSGAAAVGNQGCSMWVANREEMLSLVREMGPKVNFLHLTPPQPGDSKLVKECLQEAGPLDIALRESKYSKMATAAWMATKERTMKDAADRSILLGRVGEASENGSVEEGLSNIYFSMREDLL